MLEIRKNIHNQKLVLDLKGDLDATSCPRLNSMAMTAIREGYKVIVFNFEHVCFVGSSGLRVFYTLLKECENNETQLVLCHVPPSIDRVFKTVHLYADFPVYETIDEALKGS